VEKLRKELEEDADSEYEREVGASAGGEKESGGKRRRASKRQQWRILPSTSSEGATGRGTGKKHQELSKARCLDSSAGKRKIQRTLPKEDPLGPAWAPVGDIPPVEINRLGFPCGLFWDHMRPYVFERGAYVFPWHVS
jgi:hypothetical protein